MSHSATSVSSASFPSWVSRLLVRELEAFERELALCENDSLVWSTVPGVTNSLGTLVLHVTGNLQHFIGQVLGRTGYLRDREHEFRARDLPREALVAELRQTVAVVQAVLPTVTEETLAREFPEPVGGVRLSTGLFLTHLCAHLAFHLGQAGYVRRALTGNNQSAGPLPLPPLATPAAEVG